MVDILPDLEVIVPSLGVLGLLGWLIVRLAIQNRQDRIDHRDARADLREQVRALRGELAETHRQLDEARRARWAAEDKAAEYRRRLAVHEGLDGERRH